MAFIRLPTVMGTEMHVNPHHVVRVEEQDGGSIVVCCDGTNIYVRWSVAQAIGAIEAAYLPPAAAWSVAASSQRRIGSTVAGWDERQPQGFEAQLAGTKAAIDAAPSRPVEGSAGSP